MDTHHKTVRIVRADHKPVHPDAGPLSEYKRRATGLAGSKARPATSGRWVKVVVLLGLACVALVITTLLVRQSRVRSRRQAYALTGQVDAADRIRLDIQAVTAAVSEMVPVSRRHVASAKASEAFVLGTLGQDHTPPPETAPQPVEKRGPEPESADEDLQDSEIPEGIMSPRQLQRMREKGTAAPAPRTPEPRTAPARKAPVHRVRLTTQAVLDEAQAVSEKAAKARDQSNESLKLRNRVARARDIHDSRRLVRKLQASLADLRILKIEAAEALRRAEESAREAADMEALARERQEETKREEAEQHRKDALAQLARKELTLLAALRDDVRPMLDTHDYRQASETCRTQGSEFSTNEARAAAEALAERYSRLQALKRFIIDQLNTEAFRWGWGHGGNARDVVGATDKDVKVNRASIPWSEVDARQMLRFVEHCLARPGVTQKARGEQALAAALFCDQKGGADAARRYARRAVKLCPSLEDDVQRLLPNE